LKKYEELLTTAFDIIYWNRSNIEEKSKADTLYGFCYDDSKNRLSKLLGFLRFRNFTLRILKKNSYSKIIVLNIHMGILLKTFLITNYQNKYLIDIRDYTYENNRFYYDVEKQLINNSAINVISSIGFEDFLPKSNYTVVHNDSVIDGTIIEKYRQKNQEYKEKIIISNIGLIRFYDQIIKFITIFKNDERFELRFFGKGANALHDFLINNNIKNVVLRDQFSPSETINYFYQTDVIFNLYGNNTPLLDYALSNKLYFAAKMGMPILVCSNTYMEKISHEFGFGYTINFDDKNITDNFYNYYQSISWNHFYENCNRFVEKVNLENSIFTAKVKEFINKE
jgi:hypothetical protein